MLSTRENNADGDCTPNQLWREGGIIGIIDWTKCWWGRLRTFGTQAANDLKNLWRDARPIYCRSNARARTGTVAGTSTVAFNIVWSNRSNSSANRNCSISRISLRCSRVCIHISCQIYIIVDGIANQVQQARPGPFPFSNRLLSSSVGEKMLDDIQDPELGRSLPVGYGQQRTEVVVFIWVIDEIAKPIKQNARVQTKLWRVRARVCDENELIEMCSVFFFFFWPMKEIKRRNRGRSLQALGRQTKEDSENFQF